jgi:hypothetical protein
MGDPDVDEAHEQEDRQAGEQARLLARAEAAEAALERKTDEHEVTWRDWKYQRERAEFATNAADAAGEAVGAMAVKVSAMIAERRQLLAVVDAARSACQTFGDWWMSDERNESDTNSLTRSMNLLLSALKDIGVTIEEATDG